MLSVRGVYRDGRVELLEPIPAVKSARVIVTVLDEPREGEKPANLGVFDDLVGVVEVREDGAREHDRYLARVPTPTPP
ncbi:MAG: hypothetical protein AB1578_10625 [Thermodesulfobacteriota bacterium]